MMFSRRKSRCQRSWQKYRRSKLGAMLMRRRRPWRLSTKIMAATQKILDAEGIHGDARIWAREHGFNTDDVPPPRQISKDDLDSPAAQAAPVHAVAPREWCNVATLDVRPRPAGRSRVLGCQHGVGGSYSWAGCAGGLPARCPAWAARVADRCRRDRQQRRRSAAGRRWPPVVLRIQRADAAGSPGCTPFTGRPWPRLCAWTDGTAVRDRIADRAARHSRTAIVLRRRDACDRAAGVRCTSTGSSPAGDDAPSVHPHIRRRIIHRPTHSRGCARAQRCSHTNRW